MQAFMSAEWTPTTEHRRDRVTAAAARSLHDLLDRSGAAPAEGERLPILWHWLAFTPQASQCDIGQDGNPTTGGFLPPTAGRRRMYAGGKVTVTGDVRIDQPLERASVVSHVAGKRGKSGALLFVTVDHEILATGGAIRDRNDIVYKDPQPTSTVAPVAQSLGDNEWTGGRTVNIDPVVLFRFSALTYNAHRLHYDRDYATKEEGYSGLVVHGPLQAILLADLAHRMFPDQAVESFAFRSNAPAFDNSPLQLRGLSNAGATELELAVFTGNGTQSMSARATLAPRKEKLI